MPVYTSTVPKEFKLTHPVLSACVCWSTCIGSIMKEMDTVSTVSWVCTKWSPFHLSYYHSVYKEETCNMSRFSFLEKLSPLSFGQYSTHFTSSSCMAIQADLLKPFARTQDVLTSAPQACLCSTSEPRTQPLPQMLSLPLKFFPTFKGQLHVHLLPKAFPKHPSQKSLLLRNVYTSSCFYS